MIKFSWNFISNFLFPRSPFKFFLKSLVSYQLWTRDSLERFQIENGQCCQFFILFSTVFFSSKVFKSLVLYPMWTPLFQCYAGLFREVSNGSGQLECHSWPIVSTPAAGWIIFSTLRCWCCIFYFSPLCFFYFYPQCFFKFFSNHLYRINCAPAHYIFNFAF